MANPRHNKQTANRRGAMGGGMMRKRPGYKAGNLLNFLITQEMAKLHKKTF